LWGGAIRPTSALGDLAPLLLVIRDISKWKREIDTRYEEILRLSSPVIALDEGVLLVPIVGELTSQRAAHLTSAVLDAVQRRESHSCIIDIRGITSMDGDVGVHLVRIVAASELMGCTTILSGLSPEIVQRICAADLSLERVRTVGSLKQAVELVRRRMKDKRRRRRVH
jgi:anti-anti-sigma regulatory factor